MAHSLEMVGLLEVRERSTSCAISSLVVDVLLWAGGLLVVAGCFFGPPPLLLPFCFPFFLLDDFRFGGMVELTLCPFNSIKVVIIHFKIFGGFLNEDGGAKVSCRISRAGS